LNDSKNLNSIESYLPFTIENHLETISKLITNIENSVDLPLLARPNPTQHVCFLCECQKHQLVYSITDPFLWFWHYFPIYSTLGIPNDQFVLCILHAFQRIVEKQLMQTLKDNSEAYKILQDFFAQLNKTKLKQDYNIREKLEFYGPFHLRLEVKEQHDTELEYNTVIELINFN
jgi:hypothetical protein